MIIYSHILGICQNNKIMNILTEDVLKLFLSLLSLTVIIICLSNRLKELQDSKVHIYYITSIAAILIVCSATYICTESLDSKAIFEYISFASTISSLIMSVVAIIFTIVLSKDGYEQNVKLKDALDTLQRTISDFESKSSKLDEIAEKLEGVRQQVNEIPAKLKDKFNPGGINATTLENSGPKSGERETPLNIQE